MFCTRCGVALRETDRFCSQCGTSVSFTHNRHRELSRPMMQKRIGGVCAGFARYFDCDITLMRVLWLVVSLGTGVGFIAYVVAWIAMPKDYSDLLAVNSGLVPQGSGQHSAPSPT